MVLLGLWTRLAVVPLIGTMVVAIATAKAADLHDLSDLFSLSEYLFIVVLLWLFAKGAGCFSLDSFLSRKCAPTTDLPSSKR